MENFLKALLQEQTVGFHLAGLIFCLMGVLVYKWYQYRKHVAKCEAKEHSHSFSLKYWLKKNAIEVFISLLVSFIGVRFLDVILHEFNDKIESLVGFALPHTEDQVAYYLIFGFITQILISKFLSKKN